MGHGKTNLIKVSIRSPRRSEGRSKTVNHDISIDYMFQSAPPAGARGDVEFCVQVIYWFMFQSAPPAGARGDRLPFQRVLLYSTVSIRSPRRSEGRCLDM